MTSLLLRAFLAVLVACTAAAPAWGKPPPSRSVEGVVTQVTDGDSLWVTPPGQRGIEVRLRDIDAPEICQAWGEEARRALEGLVLGQERRAAHHRARHARPHAWATSRSTAWTSGARWSRKATPGACARAGTVARW